MNALQEIENKKLSEHTPLDIVVIGESSYPLQLAAADELSGLRARLASSRGECEILETLFLWEAGELTEGQAAKLLGVDRLEARNIRSNKINAFAWSEKK